MALTDTCRAVSLGAVTIAAACCALAGCTRSVDLPYAPTPTLSPTPTASGTPTATPTPILVYGDGRDGDLVVSENREVNVCEVLVSTTSNRATVASAIPVDAGDVVLLWQVQDGFVPVSMIGTTADLLAFGDAGRWELATVTSSEGTDLLLHPPPSIAYRSDLLARAQVCHVPQFGNVTVENERLLRAFDWDGETGGIVAFFASGTLDLNGTSSAVTANGDGFRGGVVRDGESNAEGNVVVEVTTDFEQAGAKGEGLDPTWWGFYARGNVANGGGGGNAHNAGGAGGGNGGTGGRGGWQWEMTIGDTPNPAPAGKPGAALLASVRERLFLGGGGGAGESHHGTGVSGADGGGVVLVFASRLTGTGGIRANGVSAPTVTLDGGSGGGAGGTVFVVVSDGTAFAGDFRATGGDGGNIDATEPHGPGGGGAGGRVRVEGISAPAILVPGGPGGTNVNFGNPWGASSGFAGVIEQPD